MAQQPTDERYRLTPPKFIDPALLKALRSGTRKGVVRDGGVMVEGDHRLEFVDDERPADGTSVVVSERGGDLYCRTEQQVKREHAQQNRRKREREHQRQRRQDRARAEALRFWQSYDVPFDFDVRVKVRLSGLKRGSTGTGWAKDTVEHLYVREAFEDGRLSRSTDCYLCDDDAHIPAEKSETISDSDGNTYLQPVTCKACLKLMERWEQTGDN